MNYVKRQKRRSCLGWFWLAVATAKICHGGLLARGSDDPRTPPHCGASGQGYCWQLQILRPPRNNEAQAFTCQLTTFFIAPWARGHGLAQMIVAESEALAKSEGFSMINLDVRSTQDRAIQSFEARGFTRYATNDFYARVNGDFVSGFYYRKELK